MDGYLKIRIMAILCEHNEYLDRYSKVRTDIVKALGLKTRGS